MTPKAAMTINLAVGFMGVMLGPILQVAVGLRNGGEIVGLAAGGTGAIFLTLAGIAATTKKDFSFLGKFLMVGIVLLILASLANIFFQIPALALTLSAVAILLFSGFLLYDVSRVVNGGETNYVMATLAIYLDIYNIFVNLLQLLMAFMGDDRRRQGKQRRQNGRNTNSGPGRDERWSGHGVIPRAWFRLACAAESRERLRTPSIRASVVWDWARSSSTSEVSPSSNERRISARRSAAACSRSTASAAPRPADSSCASASSASTGPPPIAPASRPAAVLA